MTLGAFKVSAGYDGECTSGSAMSTVGGGTRSASLRSNARAGGIRAAVPQEAGRNSLS